VKTIEDVKNEIEKCKSDGNKEIRIHFATKDAQSIHPQHGVPQLYHNQLDIIAKHLCYINLLPTERGDGPYTHADITEALFDHDTTKKISNTVIKKAQKVAKALQKIKKPKKLTQRILQKDEEDVNTNSFNNMKIKGHLARQNHYQKDKISSTYFGHILLKIVVQRKLVVFATAHQKWVQSYWEKHLWHRWTKHQQEYSGQQQL